MSVEDAVARAVQDDPDLLAAVAQARPRAWGALAAKGIVTFRHFSGRRPTEAERRAIWSGLWSVVTAVVQRASVEAPRTCGHLLDARRYAICGVCAGLRLCVECARGHLCTSECSTRGCLPGLCVKVVRDGVPADSFGVP